MTDIAKEGCLCPIDLGQGLGPLSLGIIGARVTQARGKLAYK
jgi:hypothetical protein